MREFLIFGAGLAAAMLAAVLLIVCIAVPITYIGNALECHSYHKLTGLETDTTIALGCMAHTKDGRWIDVDASRKNETNLTVHN